MIYKTSSLFLIKVHIAFSDHYHLLSGKLHIMDQILIFIVHKENDWNDHFLKFFNQNFNLLHLIEFNI